MKATTLLHAAEILEREAEAIKRDNSVPYARRVRWSDDAAKADHDEMIAIAAELRTAADSLPIDRGVDRDLRRAQPVAEGDLAAAVGDAGTGEAGGRRERPLEPASGLHADADREGDVAVLARAFESVGHASKDSA